MHYQFWLGALMAALMIAPWHLVMYVRHGQPFVDIYLFKNLIARTASPLAGHTGDKFTYFRIMQRTFVPWLYYLPVSMAIVLQDNLLDRSRPRVLLILATLTTFLYSVVVATKIQVYFLPVYPALAIFIAYAIDKAYENYRTIAFFGLVFATFMAALLATNKVIAGYLLLILPMSFLAIRYFGRIRSHQVATLAMFGFLLALSVMVNVRGRSVLPLYNAKQASVAELAKVVSQMNPVSEASIVGFALEKDLFTDYAVEGPAATYYSNRTVKRAKDFAELYELVGKEEAREIFIAERYLAAISEEYEIEVKAKVDPLVYGTIVYRYRE